MAVILAFLFLACPITAKALFCRGADLVCVLPSQFRENSTRAFDCMEASSDPSTVRGALADQCADGLLPCCINRTAADRKGGPPPPIGEIAGTIAFGLVTSMSCCFVLVFCQMMRRHKLKAQSPKKVITAVEIEQQFPEVPIDGQPQCVVCLVEVDGNGRKLPCGHCFHADCLMNWWTHTPRSVLECPTCRQVASISTEETSKQYAGSTSSIVGQQGVDEAIV